MCVTPSENHPTIRESTNIAKTIQHFQNQPTFSKSSLRREIKARANYAKRLTIV
jgi:hypothetical protein